MDWVSNGHKYDVEFNFGMVDTDSLMARVENSKESMRNSTIVDADGANEVLLVNLSPKNWATLCKQKQEGWFRRNGQYSLEQLEAEIQRLQRLLTSYEVLRQVTTPKRISRDPNRGANGAPAGASGAPSFPLANPEDMKPASDLKASDDALEQAFKDLYIAEAVMNSQEAKVAKLPEDQRNTEMASEDYRNAASNLDKARVGLAAAIKGNKEMRAAWTKYMTASMQGKSAYLA